VLLNAALYKMRENSPTIEEIYRGEHPQEDNFLANKVEQYRTKGTYIEKSFLSTTQSKKVAEGFSGQFTDEPVSENTRSNCRLS
jgi:hypothetical protein